MPRRRKKRRRPEQPHQYPQRPAIKFNLAKLIENLQSDIALIQEIISLLKPVVRSGELWDNPTDCLFRRAFVQLAFDIGESVNIISRYLSS